MLKKMSSERKLYIFDTFSGIVNADINFDQHKNGEFNEVNLDDVKKFLSEFDNIEWCIGVFPDTFINMNIKDIFSFIHSDTDTYFGTVNTLKYFTPLLNIGGVILFDDYEWKNCLGIKKGIDDFFSTYDDKDKYEQIRLNDYQLVVLRKN